MMVKFEENEYLIMAMFQMENRQQTMGKFAVRFHF